MKNREPHILLQFPVDSLEISKLQRATPPGKIFIYMKDSLILVKNFWAIGVNVPYLFHIR